VIIMGRLLLPGQSDRFELGTSGGDALEADSSGPLV
jgi:hypothetical protein